MYNLPTNSFNIKNEKTIFVDGSNRKCYLIPCHHCNKETYHPRYVILRAINKNWEHFFCSQLCSKSFYNKTQEVICQTCGSKFFKKFTQIQKTSNNFCSRSCAAIFNNKNKTSGYRRSKLEIFLEEQIMKFYSELGFLFNDRKTISSELDIFSPILGLAFQINGPVHYKPIYGNDKLAKIMLEDERKRTACQAKQIHLIEIDVSKDINFEKTKNDRWQEIDEIIKSKLSTT